LVRELKRSLRKRDELIIGIVDSLLPQPMMEQTQLSLQERNSIYIEAEKNNVLSNVKRSLMDNVRFIELTTLEPDDLNEIKKQQNQFAEFWQSSGAKLIDIYAGKNKKSKEIKEIDSLFSMWNLSLEQEVWRNIREEFSYNNINLIEFTNGEEFTNVLISFIDDAIKNIGVKSPEGSNLTPLIISIVVWTFGEMIFLPSAGVYVAEISPAKQRGEYMGYYQMTFSFAFMIGPWLGAQVLEHIGSFSLWTGCFALGAISALMMLKLGKGFNTDDV